MLREGASLAEIAQVLRHREIKTTAIYAKVDRTRLQSARDAVAGRCVMTDLRAAAHDYLAVAGSSGSSSSTPARRLRTTSLSWSAPARSASRPSSR